MQIFDNSKINKTSIIISLIEKLNRSDGQTNIDKYRVTLYIILVTQILSSVSKNLVLKIEIIITKIVLIVQLYYVKKTK